MRFGDDDPELGKPIGVRYLNFQSTLMLSLSSTKIYYTLFTILFWFTLLIVSHENWLSSFGKRLVSIAALLRR
jgi:hypothetical protein